MHGGVAISILHLRVLQVIQSHVHMHQSRQVQSMPICLLGLNCCLDSVHGLLQVLAVYNAQFSSRYCIPAALQPQKPQVLPANW